MNDQTKALLNHLLQTYKKDVLVGLFGISAGMWRQHKAFIDTNGESGTKISPNHYPMIKRKYIEYLSDKLKETKDLEIE